MIKILNIGPKNARIFDVEILKQPSFVKIYHPSCSHCTTMKPAWNKLVSTIKNKYKGNVSLFDVHADALANIKTPAFHSINGYPSLKIIKNGKTTDYDGDRSHKDMLNFCLKNLDLTKILEVYKGGKQKKYKLLHRTKMINKVKKTKTKKLKTKTKKLKPKKQKTKNKNKK